MADRGADPLSAHVDVSLRARLNLGAVLIGVFVDGRQLAVEGSRVNQAVGEARADSGSAGDLPPGQGVRLRVTSLGCGETASAWGRVRG